jgi:hypothetical protein
MTLRSVVWLAIAGIGRQRLLYRARLHDAQP